MGSSSDVLQAESNGSESAFLTISLPDEGKRLAVGYTEQVVPAPEIALAGMCIHKSATDG